MPNVKNSRSNSYKTNSFSLNRVNQVFGAHSFIEALLPVRFLGLCVGVMPFNFIVEPGSSRAVPNILSTLIAIGSFGSHIYCSTTFFYSKYLFQTSETRLEDIYKQVCGYIVFSLGYVMMCLTTLSAIASRHADARTMELFAEIEGIFAELNEKNDFSNMKMNTIGRLGVVYFLEIGQALFLTGELFRERGISLYVMFSVIYIPIIISTTTLIIFRSFASLLSVYGRGLNRLLLNMPTRLYVGSSEHNSFPNVHRERALRNEPLYYIYTETQNYSKRLSILIRLHDRICDCADNVNVAHGFRNLVIITYVFVTAASTLFTALTICLYWRGKRIEAIVIYIYISQVIVNLLLFYDMVNSCEDCFNEVSSYILKIKHLSLLINYCHLIIEYVNFLPRHHFKEKYF